MVLVGFCVALQLCTQSSKLTDADHSARKAGAGVACGLAGLVGRLAQVINISVNLCCVMVI
jgi:hypothetical protein